MVLTLFPTKICLKFASVPVPEAHKYVIPPISYGSLFSLRPVSLAASPSTTHGDSSQPLTCFCGAVVARGNIRGNTVNHLSRKKTQCNIPVVPVETPPRMSPLPFSHLSFFLPLITNLCISSFLFFKGEGVTRHKSTPYIAENTLKRRMLSGYSRTKAFWLLMKERKHRFR